jgi:hypothetical protein
VESACEFQPKTAFIAFVLQLSRNAARDFEQISAGAAARINDNNVRIGKSTWATSTRFYGRLTRDSTLG